MKKFLLGAAAVMAVAAPGAAAAQSGYVGGVWAQQKLDAIDDEADAFGIDGAVLFGAGSLGVEIDGQVLDGDDTDTSYALTGHLFTRNDDHLFGGYATFTDNDVDSTWAVGLEANKYFDKWTLNGAVGYGEADEADGGTIGVDVGVSMFATDNLRIDASIGYADPDDGDDNAMIYGLGGELGFGGFSLGLGWTHVESDTTNLDVDTLAATFRLNFGNETLLERDRSGASQAGRTALGSLIQVN